MYIDCIHCTNATSTHTPPILTFVYNLTLTFFFLFVSRSPVCLVQLLLEGRRALTCGRPIGDGVIKEN